MARILPWFEPYWASMGQSHVRRQTTYPYSSAADSGTYPGMAGYSPVQDSAFDLQYEV